MNTPDQVFKLQAQLGTWRGTQKVAGWLAIACLAICVVGVALILLGKEKNLGMALAPLGTVAICGILRAQAKEKIRAIEARLSS
jgi:hypothetical protein